MLYLDRQGSHVAEQSTVVSVAVFLQVTSCPSKFCLKKTNWHLWGDMVANTVINEKFYNFGNPAKSKFRKKVSNTVPFSLKYALSAYVKRRRLRLSREQ